METGSSTDTCDARALIERGAVMGEGASVGAWAHIHAGARIGRECRIGDHVEIGGQVELADRVSIRSHACLRDRVHVESDVLIDSGVVIGRDASEPCQGGHTTIRQGVVIGANATLYAVSVGQQALIRAGAVVRADVPPYAIIEGNPAEIVGYVGADLVTPREVAEPSSSGCEKNRTRARLIALPSFTDMRGSLSVIEWHKQVPFAVKRIFYTYDTPSTKVRGEHAHRQCHQFLIAVAGTLNVIADDGRQRDEYVLDSPTTGLYLPPGLWGVQYKQQPNTVLLVLASHDYDPGDYIRDYREFLEYANTLR